MTPEAIVDYCLRMREEHGSTIFEGKLIMGDPALEIRTVACCAKRSARRPQIKLDSNMQWSLTTARRVLREIEPFNIRNYEDPVATFEEMAALRQHSTHPVLDACAGSETCRGARRARLSSSAISRPSADCRRR